ncbi:MAG: (2Fe-2S)-binding protein [Verrucomicrobia subdivision 3 bacterium]|nr:(2Fe-2S)-binding protein [Limisphaerales bacterium]
MNATAEIKTQTLTLDGDEVPFREGETIYEVAQRAGREVPTLCYDARLEAFGACRLCVVQLEGARNPVASCTTPAEAGMVVHTSTEAIEKHRRTLLELVASENPDSTIDPLRGFASQELNVLLDRHEVQPGRFTGEHSGTTSGDDNPFILRDYDHCISCYRCVRVCAEQEGDHAITMMNRGFDKQITAEFNNRLKESACTFCGQCVQTCPTGALGDRKAMRAESLPGKLEKTRSVCPYCGVGCQVDLLSKEDKLVGIQPAMDGPANEGALCIKGQFAFDFVQHDDRLTKPLVRGDDGELHEVDWNTALDRAAEGFRKALEEHGRHAIYGVASGRAPSEAAYTMQKFIRAGFGTNQIDNCSRA